ncbi:MULTISPECIES: hypothetical protein [Protofrankia]|uniref:VWA domain-containing protein n=1 Tax=Protofrankia coriariae TaxID=1562887 RepID=A0ABR5F883_9ACTN|nr:MULTISPECIES: hypothetical protein [Protofrankia]KLL12938.1 hypothetical protein FrCorBMG51_02305 [Protofrankia coriariae]ONH36453.1 hypothetical protein BL254_06705 [Protofrankia sp. BMG5.30]
MGSGAWSTDVYAAAASYRKSSGRSAFHYSDSVRHSSPRDSWKAHPGLDPHGVGTRESRDSDEHPTSLAIGVLFDVTGSMGKVPRTLQSKLPDLLGLLIRKGYVDDPQILFGAVGDATCDRVPLQIGQFESDNRMDDHLGNIFIESGGGGQKTESYELALYFMARHTSIDCYDRRGKRGYLFLIGDEMPYRRVKRREVAAVIGDKLAEDIPVEHIVAEAQRSYEVYYILPQGASHAGDTEVLTAWRALLGQNVIELDDLDAVCETIALTIGLAEDAIDLDEGLGHLRETGGDAPVDAVGKALTAYARDRGAVVVSDGLPGLDDGPKGITRL